MKTIYVVCKNFNTPNVQFFDINLGWNTEQAELFDSQTEAYVACVDELGHTGVSLEKFITKPAQVLH